MFQQHIKKNTISNIYVINFYIIFTDNWIRFVNLKSENKGQSNVYIYVAI